MNDQQTLTRLVQQILGGNADNPQDMAQVEQSLQSILSQLQSQGVAPTPAPAPTPEPQAVDAEQLSSVLNLMLGALTGGQAPTSEPFDTGQPAEPTWAEPSQEVFTTGQEVGEPTQVFDTGQAPAPAPTWVEPKETWRAREQGEQTALTQYRVLTREQIVQLAQDIYNGLVFTDRHVTNLNDVYNVFMPLVFLSPAQHEEMSENPPGLIYEYLDAAGPRSINGNPCFTSMRTLSEGDAQKVMRVYKVLVQRMGEPRQRQRV